MPRSATLSSQVRELAPPSCKQPRYFSCVRVCVRDQLITPPPFPPLPPPLLFAGGGGAAGMAVRRGITADMHKCKICMQTFPSTCKAVTLAEHSDSKHPKNTFAECFDVPAA
jgi:hypothetical protein